MRMNLDQVLYSVNFSRRFSLCVFKICTGLRSFSIFAIEEFDCFQANEIGNNHSDVYK